MNINPIPSYPESGPKTERKIKPIEPIEPSLPTQERKGGKEQEGKEQQEERKKALTAKQEQDKFQAEMIRKQLGLGTKIDKKS